MNEDLQKKKEEFRAEIEERKRVENLPENVGWVRKYERNTHLNNHIEREQQSGHRVDPKPSLDKLDGNWES